MLLYYYTRPITLSFVNIFTIYYIVYSSPHFILFYFILFAWRNISEYFLVFISISYLLSCKVMVLLILKALNNSLSEVNDSLERARTANVQRELDFSSSTSAEEDAVAACLHEMQKMLTVFNGEVPTIQDRNIIEKLSVSKILFFYQINYEYCYYFFSLLYYPLF